MAASSPNRDQIASDDDKGESAPFLATPDSYEDLPAVELGERKRRPFRSQSTSPSPEVSFNHDHSRASSISVWMSSFLQNAKSTIAYEHENPQPPFREVFGRPFSSTSTGRRFFVYKGCLYLLCGILILLGLLQTFYLCGGLYLSFYPANDYDPPPAWRGPEHVIEGGQTWPTDFTADIIPIPCHSHNDYWRKEPLFSALKAGFLGVEADVWLRKGDLYVGHSLASLTPSRTFQSLYINPLLQILDRQNPITEFHPERDSPPNGVYDTDPEQSLVLLVDFKQDGDTLWPYVYSQLQPLRDKGYLSYYNGSQLIQSAITVVCTGGAPFHKILETKAPRDMFFDAPLEIMGDRSLDEPKDTAWRHEQGSANSTSWDPTVYTASNSYYASTSMYDTVGIPLFWKFTDRQIQKIRNHIQGAHAQGLKARYWGIPAWPRSMRNYIWAVLVEEGIDYLNIDDLASAARGEWGPPKKKGWWRLGETFA